MTDRYNNDHNNNDHNNNDQDKTTVHNFADHQSPGRQAHGRESWGNPAVENRLTSAMRAQGDRHEPTASSFADLSNRIDQGQQRQRSFARPLAYAAAAIVAVGLGAVAANQMNGQQLDTTSPQPSEQATSTTTSPLPSQPTPTGDINAPTSTTVAPDEQLDGDEMVDAVDSGDTDGSDSEPDAGQDNWDGDPGPMAPVRATQKEAAEAFLTMLRLDNSTVGEIDNNVATITSGDSTVGRLRLASVDSGWTVDWAMPVDAVAVETVTAVNNGGVDEEFDTSGTLSVTGEGTGFEGVVTVSLISAIDGRLLAREIVVGGTFEEPAAFTADLKVVGNEKAWVVAQSTIGADEFDGAFSAKRATYRSKTKDTTIYSVVRVPSNDSDGGLVVRAWPGTGADPVATLRAGRSGISRVDKNRPVAVGDAVWWEITTGDGDSGWVNSAFLAPTFSSSDLPKATIDEAKDVFRLIEAGYYDQIRFTRRTSVAIGTIGSPILVDGTSLETATGWQLEREFGLPPENPDPFKGSLLALLGVEEWKLEDIVEGGRYTQAIDKEEADIYFSGIASVTYQWPAETLDRVHVFYEPTPAGIEVVGIMFEPWRP